MKSRICTLYFGDNWFCEDKHVMFLILRFAGLADTGRKSSYFYVYFGAAHKPRFLERGSI